MLPDYLAWADELTNAADDERRFASRIIGKDLLKVLRGVALLQGADYEASIPRIAAQVAQFVPVSAVVAAALLALYTEPSTKLDDIQRAATSAVTLLESCPEFALLLGTAGTGAGVPGEAQA